MLWRSKRWQPQCQVQCKTQKNPHNPPTLHCSCFFRRDAAPTTLQPVPLSPVCQPPTPGLIFLQHPKGYDYFIPFFNITSIIQPLLEQIWFFFLINKMTLCVCLCVCARVSPPPSEQRMNIKPSAKIIPHTIDDDRWMEKGWSKRRTRIASPPE